MNSILARLIPLSIDFDLHPLLRPPQVALVVPVREVGQLGSLTLVLPLLEPLLALALLVLAELLLVKLPLVVRPQVRLL
jgi:hypothetical protein